MTKNVGILVGLISIVTSPWTTYDPINPPKLVLLGICGFSCLAYLILNRRKIKLDRFLLILSSIFVFQALISMFFSDGSVTEGFFGHYGRYFGFFTWTMLFVLMIYMSIAEKFEFFIKVFLFVGSISLLYSILQYFGKDPAPWQNDFNPILGFLGNPNFQSSFLGLFFISLCGVLIQKYRNKTSSIILLCVLAILAFLIVISGSIQGVFVAIVGILSLILYFFFAKKYNKIFWSLVFIGSISSILFGAAIVGVGPLVSLLYKGSLVFRGDYWLAAFSMSKANWFTGVGPDQFGTWYRFYRHEESVTRINADVASNSAHNGYLDFAANLGILTLIVYLLLLMYALVVIARFIKSQPKIDWTHASLVAVFLGFQAQFLISPNQLGLVIWGWIFLGAIFGYRVAEVIDGSSVLKKRQRIVRSFKDKPQISPVTPLLIGAIAGLVVTGPIFYANMQFRSALLKADAVKIISAVNIWPRNEELFNYTANILFVNNLQKIGYDVTNSGLKEFPNSYYLWRQKAAYRYLTDSERREVVEQLHRLDPFNPEWIPKS